ncbi:MAG: DUF4139 domain-containing protein, partial [Myxococcales bacterium]|nr:DUF4139 domain-containing protein [Myxococcales bacterium]
MTVELPIVGVTVHPDGAIVRRRGRCDIQEGRVRVHRLPLLLEPGTVRAAVREGTLRDVRLDFDLPFDDRGDAVAEQVAVVENLAAQARVDAEIAHVDAMRALARGLAPGFDPEGPAPTAASLEGWAALDAALDPWLEALDARARELQREREELGRRAQSLRWALQSRSDESLWRRWMPTRRLDLAVEAAGSVEVEVSYAIVGARWSPAYAVDFDRDLSRGRLTMRALVGQATGEDWSDVEVAFASVPCRRVVDLPELASMKLGTAAPPKPTGWRPLPDDLDGLFPTDPVSVLATENERSMMDQESGAFLDDEKPDVSSRRGPPMPSPDAMPMPSPAPM